MPSVKVVLRTNKTKADGTAPLAIRITKDRKSKFIFTNYWLKEDQWDKTISRVKKSHPNSSRLNNLLLKLISDTNNLLIEDETNENDSSLIGLKNKVKRSGKQVSFFELAEQRIFEYEQKGTFSVSQSETARVKNIKKFHGSKDLSFREISDPFIKRFSEYSQGVLNHSKRSTTNHLILIRTLFNRAIKEGIVDKKYYPFGGEGVKIKINSGHKIGLTQEEVTSIESLDLESNSTIWHTRNVWLFAFYFAGIRISDVIELKWSDIQDNRLRYIMNKNEKPVTLKVPDKAQKILLLYSDNSKTKDGYVFPFLNKANFNDPRDIFRKSRNASRLFNKYLKRIADLASIDKNLSNHIARHSFGNIAGDKVHPLMLQKLYRHGDLKTTLNYQANFIHKDADDALDSVIDF